MDGKPYLIASTFGSGKIGPLTRKYGKLDASVPRVSSRLTKGKPDKLFRWNHPVSVGLLGVRNEKVVWAGG